MVMMKDTTETARHCGYCGIDVGARTSALERFGERFCSHAHADEFASGVRIARMQAAARQDAAPMSCALPSAGPRRWTDYLKRAACWGAPALLLLALPLFWSGNTAAASGGTILSAVAFLACPLGMYFMMRAMGNMNGHSSQAKDDAKDPGPGGR